MKTQTKTNELTDIIGDSKIFKLNDNSNHTFFKKHITGFAYSDESESTSKIYLYFEKSPKDYKELWYYKELYSKFLKDLKMIQKHFED